MQEHVENWELLQAYQTAHPKQPSPPLLEVSWGTVNTWTPARLSVSAGAKVPLDRTSGSASATASGWEPGDTCSQLRAVQVTGCHMHMSSLWRLNSSLQNKKTLGIDFSTLWCAPLQIAHSKVQEQGAQAESSDMPVSPPDISKTPLRHWSHAKTATATTAWQRPTKTSDVHPMQWSPRFNADVWSHRSKPFIRMLMTDAQDAQDAKFFWSAWHQTTLNDVAFSGLSDFYTFLYPWQGGRNKRRRQERRKFSQRANSVKWAKKAMRFSPDCE